MDELQLLIYQDPTDARLGFDPLPVCNRPCRRPEMSASPTDIFAGSVSKALGSTVQFRPHGQSDRLTIPIAAKPAARLLKNDGLVLTAAIAVVRRNTDRMLRP